MLNKNTPNKTRFSHGILIDLSITVSTDLIARIAKGFPFRTGAGLGLSSDPAVNSHGATAILSSDSKSRHVHLYLTGLDDRT